MPTPQLIDPETRRIVDAASGVWIRRLIDHSRANSLLFYRPLKVGTLELTSHPEAVRRLLEGEALGSDELPVPPAAPGTGSAGPLTPSAGPSTRSAPAEEDARHQAQAALLALQRKALSNLEEKGIETLFLALGMAVWPAADGGRPHAAPVLLVPAKIESRRGGENLRLRVTGEPQMNTVLLYVLEEDCDLRISAESILGECSHEEDDGWRVDPECVFARLGAEVSGIPGFSVERRAVVANFHFAKMAMVEDIRKNGELLGSSPLIAAIAGHAGSRAQMAAAQVEVEPAELDQRPASSDYLVLDADSTQHRAIVLVGMGQNGVIQGAPGTGKSQTISNLIAQSIADGRRVLFVAEKRAALEAVIKRLNHPDVALGHLVLDLHGASVSRKEVMARIAGGLEQIRQAAPPPGVEEIHREFESRRGQLNEHARRINSPRQPTGLSVHQMIGRLLRLPAAARSDLRIGGEALAALEPVRLAEVRRHLREGASHPRLLLGSDPSPWNNAALPDGPTAQEMLDLAGRLADALWPALQRALGPVVAAAGVPAPPTLERAAALLSLLRDTRRLRENYGTDIFQAQPATLAAGLASAERGGLARVWAYLTNSRYRAARARLLGLRTSPAPAPLLLQEARQAASLVSLWAQFGGAVREVDPGEALAAQEALFQALRQLGPVLDGPALAEQPLEDVARRLADLARDTRTPLLLPAIHLARRELQAAGLARLLDDLRSHPIPPEQWSERLEYIWLHSTLDQAISTEPALAGFKGRTHEQLIAEFVRLDKERVRLAADRVRRLHATRAIEAMNQHFDQQDLVKREAAKRSRHLPLRDLLAQAPDVLTRIAPCWVASPLSVSQLLDGGARHFDLVVFDEASQVLPEEAIPSLYRAGQVVVAGDRHQLPPTTFFATAVEGEDEVAVEDEAERQALQTAAAAIGGFESLLATLEAFLPNWLLAWHYRSEDERLIAFSNHHIYDGRLVTFPSVRSGTVVSHTLVPHDPSTGSQEESASREVDEVVRQVLRHAESRPRESLGVIAMGIKHANRVQAALDTALETRPDLAGFFTLEKEDRFFIKNLETVQGDERDAIILTVGYGKNASGDLPHRFGPLTHESGHRRLNVAVTRARRRMHVVSSFSHQEINLERSGSRGVQLLKAYLEYAVNGGSRLPESEKAGEVPLNDFEADIRDALEQRGIRTRPQFGSSRYRIDLVAMHSARPGRPVLAIECDGATYHSSHTARDRDRLRQANLMRLGWRFHRIWSTDWFYNREQEAEHAVNAYQDAVRHADLEDAGGAEAPADTARSGAPPARPSPRRAERGPQPALRERESIEQYTERELLQLADWVLSDGLNRTDEEIVREMFEALPFARMGARIRSRLESIARRLRQRRSQALD